MSPRGEFSLAGSRGAGVFSRSGTAGRGSGVDPPRGGFALAGVEWSGPAGARIELRTRRRRRGLGPLGAGFGHRPRCRRRRRESERHCSASRCGWPGRHVPAAELVAGPRRAASISWPAVGAPASGLGARRSPSAVGGAGLARSPSRCSTLAPGSLRSSLARPGRGATRRRAPAGFYGTVKLAFVHHTENPNGYSRGEVAPILLAIFDYHRYVRGFFDIAYNFVDRRLRPDLGGAGGRNRRARDRRACRRLQPGVDRRGGARARSCVGPAAGGDRRTRAPAGLEALAARRADRSARSASRSTPPTPFYTPFAPGAHVSLPRVAGHRDGDLTDCPGNAFYHRLPSIRPVIAKLATSPARLTVVPAAETVMGGETLTLSGELALLHGRAPIPAAPIKLQRLAGDRATTIATAVTGSDGTWTATVPLAKSSVLRALHRRRPAAASNVVTVGVEPVITLTVISSAPLELRGHGQAGQTPHHARRVRGGERPPAAQALAAGDRQARPVHGQAEGQRRSHLRADRPDCGRQHDRRRCLACSEGLGVSATRRASARSSRRAAGARARR